MERTRRRLLGVYLELRAVPVLLWSYTAITLGTALAWYQEGRLDVAGYLVAIGVGVLLQGLVAHSVNEVADWRSGTDRDPAPRVISGGSKVIASGLLTERELHWLGVAAAVAAAVLGLVAAATWGWGLLAFGAIGLAGAVLYTVPPVRAAYRPFAGESVAFTCIWACTAGAYALQTGRISGAVAVAGIAYAAYCVGMLMMHHYLDREPDRRALPPKQTSVVVLGGAAKRYAVAWAAIATAGFALLAVLVDPRFALGAGTFAVAIVLHAAVRPEDPVSVTRAELGVILLGLAGGLGTSALLAPQLAWALIPAVVLIPFELKVAGAAHRELLARRARAAEAAPAGRDA